MINKTNTDISRPDLDAAPRVAVVGSGIAGLAAAHRLTERGFPVTLFEAASQAGGHALTVDVEIDRISAPVDVGFLVYNERTYPGLTRLFRELEVATVESDMSFAVRNDVDAVEWSGTNLAGLFAQRSNALSPRFWRMLREIVRFNRLARETARSSSGDIGETLGAFLDRHRFHRELREWYLKPMSAAIWSTPAAAVETFPVATFARFCDNHGLLQLSDRPQWRTVMGGSRQYVNRIAARIEDVRLDSPVTGVWRRPDAVEIGFRQNGQDQRETFRHVVLACHPGQSLRVLADADAREHATLRAIRFQPNRAVLHTDQRLMPRRRVAWSAWNHLVAGSDCESWETGAVAVTYWLNRLQPLPFTTPLFMTLNPPFAPLAHTVRGEFEFDHPVMDTLAVRAQRDVEGLQGKRNTWFAGAWLGHGFHEDGLRAGYAAADALAAREKSESMRTDRTQAIVA